MFFFVVIAIELIRSDVVSDSESGSEIILQHEIVNTKNGLRHLARSRTGINIAANANYEGASRLSILFFITHSNVTGIPDNNKSRAAFFPLAVEHILINGQQGILLCAQREA